MIVLDFMTDLMGDPYLARIVLLAGLVYGLTWLPPVGKKPKRKRRNHRR